MTATATTTLAVRLRGIRKSYGPVEVLHGVDFSVEPGRARALVGENGAGKSTLLGVIAGKTDDWTGEYELRGSRVRFPSIKAAQQGGIALIHQETTCLPTLTVGENVLLGRLPRRLGLLDRKAAHEAAVRALGVLGVDLDVEAPASTLGTAELQLVDIARALLADPAVLLLDEPTASLPAEGRDRLFGVVRNLLARGTAVVFISHHLDEVFDICDDVTVLRDGHVVADLATSASSPAAVAELMIGHELAAVDHAAPERRPAPAGDSVFTARDLADDEALQGIDLHVHAGEVLGVTGLLGAGQHHLVGAILGARRCRGTMTLKGRPWAPRSIRHAVDGGVGILTEDRKSDGLLLDEPVATNIGLASVLRRPFGRYRRSAERLAAARLVEELAVKLPSASAPVQSLSGGNQQKVALAKWLREPRDLLVLHEPTRGVDVGAKALIHERIRTLAEEGCAVLLVSSDLPEVVALADRAVVLRRGRVARTFDETGFSQQDLLSAASGSTHQPTVRTEAAR
ncbi:sugar ABC transporter ATP-binding protein [Micromonospora sp. NPDC005113]